MFVSLCTLSFQFPLRNVRPTKCGILASLAGRTQISMVRTILGWRDLNTSDVPAGRTERMGAGLFGARVTGLG